jgi:hypothetical protein
MCNTAVDENSTKKWQKTRAIHTGGVGARGAVGSLNERDSGNPQSTQGVRASSALIAVGGSSCTQCKCKFRESDQKVLRF